MVVLVKQVPDTQDITGDLMTPDGTVNRGALPAIANPEDLAALEEALRIRETCGGQVTVLSMGPPAAAEALRECFCRGADEVILLTDRRFAGADTLATSYALRCAIETAGGCDIVFCGRQAIDGDTGQVGPQLAEKLHVNQLTFVSRIIQVCEGDPGTITVERATEYGHEVLRSRLPVLLTITSSANIPRSPSVKRLLASKDVPFARDGGCDHQAGERPARGGHTGRFREWNLDSVGADPSRCGFAGSPTLVQATSKVTLTAGSARQVPNTPAGIAELVGELRRDHIIG